MLPASTERAIDFDESGQLRAVGLGQTKLRREESGVSVEHLQVARHAASIAKVRETARILRGNEQQPLLLAELAQLSITDQSIRHLAECLLHCLLVDQLRFESPCFGQLHLRTEPAGGEHRLEGADATDQMVVAPEKSADNERLRTARAREGDCGKYAAFATPTSAFAATSSSSARWISGLRSSSADGSPAGTSAAWGCSVNGRPRVTPVGSAPSNRLMKFSCCSIDRSRVAIWPVAA